MQTSGVDEVHCAPESWCVCLLYHKLQRRAESWGWQPLLLDGHGCESFCFGATSDPISQLRRLRQRGQAPCLRSHSSGKARNTSQAVWFRIRMEGLSLPMPGESRKGAMAKLQPFRRSVVHPGQELHHLLWQLQWGTHSPPRPQGTHFWWPFPVFQLLWMELLPLGIYFTSYYSFSWEGFCPYRLLLRNIVHWGCWGVIH